MLGVDFGLTEVGQVAAIAGSWVSFGRGRDGCGLLKLSVDSSRGGGCGCEELSGWERGLSGLASLA